MQKSIAIFIPLAILLSGCGMMSSISFSPKWNFMSDLSSRPTPAQVTKMSPDSLTRQGYVNIGSIKNQVDVCLYWENEEPCGEILLDRNLTAELCQQAAVKGGDLVVLTSDNVRERKAEYKNGKVISQKHREVTWPNADGSVRREMVWDIQYETVKGWQVFYVSGGEVWRHDPELAAKAGPLIKNAIDFERVRDAYFENTSLKVENFQKIVVNGKWGLGNEKGKTVLEPRFTDISWFAEDLAAAAEGTGYGKRWGYVDRGGAWVIPPKYDIAGDFSEGMAVVKEWGGSWGWIDKKGKLVIPVKWGDGDRSLCFREGLIQVKIGKSFGYADKLGKVVISPQFDKADHFSEGLAAVCVDEKWGYIDRQGKVVIKLQYTSANEFAKGIAMVERVGRKYHRDFIDRSGSVVAAEP